MNVADSEARASSSGARAYRTGRIHNVGTGTDGHPTAIVIDEGDGRARALPAEAIEHLVGELTAAEGKLQVKEALIGLRLAFAIDEMGLIDHIGDEFPLRDREDESRDIFGGPLTCDEIVGRGLKLLSERLSRRLAVCLAIGFGSNWEAEIDRLRDNLELGPLYRDTTGLVAWDAGNITSTIVVLHKAGEQKVLDKMFPRSREVASVALHLMQERGVAHLVRSVRNTAAHDPLGKEFDVKWAADSLTAIQKLLELAGEEEAAATVHDAWYAVTRAGTKDAGSANGQAGGDANAEEAGEEPEDEPTKEHSHDPGDGWSCDPGMPEDGEEEAEEPEDQGEGERGESNPPPPAAEWAVVNAADSRHWTVSIPVVDAGRGVEVVSVASGRLGFITNDEIISGLLRQFGRGVKAPFDLLRRCMNGVGFGNEADTVIGAVRDVGLRTKWLRTPLARMGRLWENEVILWSSRSMKCGADGPSAQLGLTLAILMAGATSIKVRRIVATGQLGGEGKSDRTVLPIRGLCGKILIVLAKCREPTTPGKKIPFLMPMQSLAGTEKLDEEAFRRQFDRPFDSLATLVPALAADPIYRALSAEWGNTLLSKVLEKCGLEPIAIKSLKEAAKVVGAETLAAGPWDRLMGGCTAAALAGGLIFLSLHLWQTQRIDIITQEPPPGVKLPLVRAASEDGLRTNPEFLLCDARKSPVARAGDWIAVRPVVAKGDYDFGRVAVVAVLYNDRQNASIRVTKGLDIEPGVWPEDQIEAPTGDIAETLALTLIAARWPETAASLGNKVSEVIHRISPQTMVPEADGYIEKVGRKLDSLFEGRTRTMVFHTIASGGEPCR